LLGGNGNIVTLGGSGDTDLNLATGLNVAAKLESKLSKIKPLTGYSDPLYAEAYITVQQFDINIDILMVNQTGETLQNVTVEFTTMGDLKVLEKPAPHTMGPNRYGFKAGCVILF
jgi:coatomer subunit beta